MQKAAQYLVPSSVQILVQCFVQKKLCRCRNELQKWFAEMSCRNRTEHCAGRISAPEGRPVYRGCGASLSCSSGGATYSRLLYRSLRRSYRNRWLPVSYKQVAPNGAKKRRAVIGAVPVQRLVQNYLQKRVQTIVQKSVQMFVQIICSLGTIGLIGNSKLCRFDAIFVQQI